MHDLLKKAGVLTAILCCGFGLAACGGGGGGTSVPAAYTGVQTQAVVTGDNAESLLLEAYESGMVGDELVILPMAVTTQTDEGSRGPLALAAALESAVRQLPLGSPAALEGGAVQTAAVQEPIHGDCGGLANSSIDVNESTGAFRGSMAFNDYCSDGVVLSGTMNFSGSYNQSTGAIKFAMQFISLTASLNGESFTVNGSMSMALNMNNGAGSFSFNMVLENSFTNKTAYLSYGIAMVPRDGYDEVTFSGRFYAHDHGYVQLSTEQPLRFTFEYPDAGMIKVSGDKGSWARLEFTGNGNYVITCSDGMIRSGLVN
jgi:hypothetical protein